MRKFTLVILELLFIFIVASCGAQEQPEEIPYVEVDSFQLHQMLQKKDCIMINVHIPYEGEISQTDLFIPYDEIEKFSDKLPVEKDARIVLYCRSDRMSTLAAQALADMGYTNIINLKGGMKTWKEAGYDLIYRER